MTCLLHILIVSHKFILYAISHACQWHATHAIHIIITHTQKIFICNQHKAIFEWQFRAAPLKQPISRCIYEATATHPAWTKYMRYAYTYIHTYMWRSSRTRRKNIPNIYFEIPVTLFYNLVIHYLFAVAHARTLAPAAHQREKICDAYFAKIRIMCSFYMAAA